MFWLKRHEISLGVRSNSGGVRVCQKPWAGVWSVPFAVKGCLLSSFNDKLWFDGFSFTKYYIIINWSLNFAEFLTNELCAVGGNVVHKQLIDVWITCSFCFRLWLLKMIVRLSNNTVLSSRMLDVEWQRFCFIMANICRTRSFSNLCTAAGPSSRLDIKTLDVG